jgi:formate dehydrogenase subunit gamma
MSQSAKIDVTSAFERVVHWVLAISCLVLVVTGLGLLYKSWTLIAAMFGGTLNLKIVHDFMAWVFMIALVPTLFMWIRDCFGLDSDDVAWFKVVGGYLTRKPVHLNMGKFNPGQKAFFWWVILGGILMSASGLALMYPDKVSTSTFQLAGAVHVLTFVTLALFIIVHIYLGTIGNPGSVSAILSGRVTRAWAKTHRPKWLAKHPDGV